VTKSRNSSLTNIKSTRDPSIGRKPSKTTNVSQTSLNHPKKYTTSNLSQRSRLGYDSNSFVSTSRNDNIPTKKISGNKLNEKSKERVIIRKIAHDNKSIGNETVDEESQFGKKKKKKKKKFIYFFIFIFYSIQILIINIIIIIINILIINFNE